MVKNIVLSKISLSIGKIFKTFPRHRTTIYKALPNIPLFSLIIIQLQSSFFFITRLIIRKLDEIQFSNLQNPNYWIPISKIRFKTSSPKEQTCQNIFPFTPAHTLPHTWIQRKHRIGIFISELERGSPVERSRDMNELICQLFIACVHIVFVFHVAIAIPVLVQSGYWFPENSQ